jgi:hypothetical protein
MAEPNPVLDLPVAIQFAAVEPLEYGFSAQQADIAVDQGL